MKAILMSIKPKWVAKILNGEKTIEIRKKFPKDYVGWVYIYCTKEKNKVLLRDDIGKTRHYSYGFMSVAKHVNIFDLNPNLCGKVIARFWCDKVEEIKLNLAARFFTKSMNEEELLKQSCLTSKELENYLWSNILFGYAIPIANLSIFDKPREIGEFKRCLLGHNNCFHHNCRKCPATSPLTRAPQSWCYVEV